MDRTTEYIWKDLGAYSSADSTSSSALGITALEGLRKQLEAATKELDAQNKIYADASTYWGSCTWRNPVLKKKGYYHNDVYADGECQAARDKAAAASSKIAALRKQIESLNAAIDKATASTVATDPTLQAAKADAEVKITKAKADAEAAIKKSEVIGAASASTTMIIGYSVAGVVLLAGIIWAVMKFRKK